VKEPPASASINEVTPTSDEGHKTTGYPPTENLKTGNFKLLVALAILLVFVRYKNEAKSTNQCRYPFLKWCYDQIFTP